MLRTAGKTMQGKFMKYLLFAALLAVSACATAPTGERGPARPLNCAYADSHCAHGEM